MTEFEADNVSERTDSPTRRLKRYQRFEDRIELPMIVLSLLLVPVVMMPLIEDLSSRSLRALTVLSAVIWLGFALEYAVLVILSPDRRHTVRTHKLDLLLVVLPFLRPVRLLRLLRLAKAGTALGRVVQAFRKILGRPGFRETVWTVAGFIVGAGGLVTIAENDQPGSTINDLGDGLWWAFVTCTTVGYGDEFPVTVTGRVIAVLLMLVGISGLSAITASVAAYFVSADDEDASRQDQAELVDRLSRIESQLDRLTVALDPNPAGEPD
jgi:voltage-gated potassium channel